MGPLDADDEALRDLSAAASDIAIRFLPGLTKSMCKAAPVG